MDDNKKDTEQLYLSEEAIEIFIFSNILHAIDNDYINLDIKNVYVNVNKNLDEYKITVAMAKDDKGKTETFTMPCDKYDDKLDMLRYMMGMTMKILTALETFAGDRPILRIVK